jgi:hypothetical protein
MVVPTATIMLALGRCRDRFRFADNTPEIKRAYCPWKSIGWRASEANPGDAYQACKADQRASDLLLFMDPFELQVRRHAVQRPCAPNCRFVFA